MGSDKSVHTLNQQHQKETDDFLSLGRQFCTSACRGVNRTGVTPRSEDSLLTAACLVMTESGLVLSVSLLLNRSAAIAVVLSPLPMNNKC